jgi:hypothetical protein
MGTESSSEQHRQRRGAEEVNPIRKSKRELRIRLVYPPYPPKGSVDQPFALTERAGRIDYTLKAGGEEYPGTTNEDGVLRQVLPTDVESASLTLYATVKGEKQAFWTIELVISNLDGCEPILGAKARLNNLGLFASETLDLSKDFIAAMDEHTDQYVRALRRFENLFGPAQDPHTAFDEKAVWARIREVYGG